MQGWTGRFDISRWSPQQRLQLDKVAFFCGVVNLVCALLPLCCSIVLAEACWPCCLLIRFSCFPTSLWAKGKLCCCRLSAYWLGHSPHTWHRWFTLKAVVLFTVRYFIYRSKSFQYYLLE